MGSEYMKPNRVLSQHTHIHILSIPIPIPAYFLFLHPIQLRTNNPLLINRYLSSDTHGLFAATASAVSHYESFLAIPSPEVTGTFSLQTHGGDGESFLTIKENTKAASGVEIRGDANTISFETTVRVRMQAKFKPKLRASKESKAYEKISKKELEGIVGRGLDDDEVRRLRKGRKEGNFHEILLDVKVSGKHDKWA